MDDEPIRRILAQNDLGSNYDDENESDFDINTKV